MNGYLITQLLHVVAKLGVADVLADGPLPSEAIARAVGADPLVLHRMLRGLAAEGVFAENGDGRFGLTEIGACLRDGAPNSLRGAVVVRGDLHYKAASGLLDAARGGGIPFDRVYGEGLFAHLEHISELAAAFHQSMTDRSRLEAAAVVGSYGFGAFRRLVDVGGGTGVLLEAILLATPGPRGVLLDRPRPVEQARKRLADAGLAARADCVVGDFFDAVPSGGDAYLLSRIVHDWDDAAAQRILARCRAAMGDGATLLLVEAVLPEFAVDSPAAIAMDLGMLTLLPGRERTVEEYRSLLATAGFRLARVIPTGSPSGIAVVEARPSTSSGRYNGAGRSCAVCAGNPRRLRRARASIASWRLPVSSTTASTRRRRTPARSR
jgi:hypothetical protein